MYKCVHFGIKELVSPAVYEKWKEKAWMFFSEDILKELDLIRDLWGYPIIINNWASGGTLRQCGLRENTSQIVKDNTSKNNIYCSAHTMGCGFDLHDSLGRNSKLHEFLQNLINNGKIKHFKRLENFKATPTWVHIDAFQTFNNKLEIF